LPVAWPNLTQATTSKTNALDCPQNYQTENRRREVY